MKLKSKPVKITNGVAIWPDDFSTSQLTIESINQGKKGFVVKANLAEGGRDILLSQDHVSDLLIAFNKGKVGEEVTIKVGDKFNKVNCVGGILSKAV